MHIRVRPSIVLFGDSLTQLGFGYVDGTEFGNTNYTSGWASLLASTYSRRADVLNRGFRGYNTNMALNVLPSVFRTTTTGDSSSNTLFVTILFGANDNVRNDESGEVRHVPIDQYGDNLKEMIASIRTSFTTPTATTNSNNSTTTTSEMTTTMMSPPPIILFTPPPVDEKKRQQYMVEKFNNPNKSLRTNNGAKQYGNKVKEIALEYNCSVVDTFTLLGGDDGIETYGKHLNDGLHLTQSGNMLIYNGLMDVLQKEHPKLTPMIDGNGRNGTIGIPLEEKTWKEHIES